MIVLPLDGVPKIAVSNGKRFKIVGLTIKKNWIIITAKRAMLQKC